MATHLHGRSLLSDIYAPAAAPDDTGHHHARTGGRWLRSPGCNEYTPTLLLRRASQRASLTACVDTPQAHLPCF